MRMMIRWTVALLLAGVAFSATAGLKIKECVNQQTLQWKEYLVGGAQGAAGNELWGFGNAANCGIELWDLTLISATAEAAPSGYAAKYVTSYDNGYLGGVGGSYSSVLWNVSGTVTALLDMAGTMHSTLSLFGTSTTRPGETLEAEIVTDFLPVVAGNECLPWASGIGCTTYDYIGGAQTGGGQRTIVSSFVQVVPEPDTLVLFASATLLGLGLRRRRAA